MKRKVQTIGLALLVLIVGSPAVSVGATGQDSASAQVVEHFRAGQQDLRSGRVSDAVEQFKAVLQLAPGLSEARINLGLSYHLVGEYKLAVAELERGLAQSPNVLGANLILGIDELRLGWVTKAVAPLERATRIDPSNQQAWSSLAEAYLHLGRYLEATRSYNAAFGSSPTADNLLRLGNAYLQMSSQLTARMAHRYAETAWARRLAGDLLSERQLWSDAARRYQLALARDPTQPGLHASLANTLLAQGKRVEAEEELRSELRADPASPRALAGLTEVELEQGRARCAVVYASRLARTAPQLALAWIGGLTLKLPPALAARLATGIADGQSKPGTGLVRAVLYANTEDRERARRQRVLMQRELKRLAEAQQPGWPACKADQYFACIRFLQTRHHLSQAQMKRMGEAQFALERYGEASNTFAVVWARNRQDPQALYWLIQSYSKMADGCFSALTGRYPNSAQAYELEAETYRARGEDSKAAEQYQRAMTIQPGNAALHEALGELYLNKHELPEAQKELEEVLELDPTRARALYLMGRLEIGLEKPQRAISYIEKALHYDPQLLEARASLGLAYLRSGRPALAVVQLEQSESLDYYGDLHYMLYQAYRDLGKTELAENALAASQALRRKTAARDQALIRSAENQ